MQKIETGIEGFDFIAEGGVPSGRATLVAGTAGSGKTVLACQFIAAGVEAYDEPGVFVTFEEPAEDIRHNGASLGWDIAAWERDGSCAIVDAAPDPDVDLEVIGRFEFGALIARIERAVQRVGARRVALDSIGAIFTRFPEPTSVRHELYRLVSALREMNVTTVITAERTDEYGPIARHGVEEFVTDNVVVLRNVLDDERRRRTVEVLKMRGTSHRKGEFPFTIIPGEGIVVIALSSVELGQGSSDIRVSSGNDELDEMCGGGLYRDSVIMVSGATGTGKTLLTTEFIAGGVRTGGRCLLFGFEESRKQLIRNARGWGIDFESMEDEGRLQIITCYPESMALEDHLVAIKQAINDFAPDRVAIDSLSALDRVATDRGFREFVIGLTSFIKYQEMCAMMTATARSLLGGDTVTESHVSTMTDSIILLRYVELFGEVRRGLSLLKMRGSQHDKTIREYEIDNAGMHIGRGFSNVSGILYGNTVHRGTDEEDRLHSMFDPDL